MSAPDFTNMRQVWADVRANLEERGIEVPELQRYWSDPAYRAAAQAERQAMADKANAAIDAGMRKYWGERTDA